MSGYYKTKNTPVVTSLAGTQQGRLIRTQVSGAFKILLLLTPGRKSGVTMSTIDNFSTKSSVIQGSLTDGVCPRI